MLFLHKKILLQMAIKTTFFFINLLLICCLACKKKSNNQRIDISNIQLSTDIVRQDSAFFRLKSEVDILKFLNENKAISEIYFETEASYFPDLAKKLSGFTQNESLKDFYTKSKEILQFDSLQTAINQSFKYIKYYYPNFKSPKIYTYFTGFAGKDLVVSDTVILIGLDYFVGKNAQFRPQVFDYQLNKYEKDYIIPQIINQLAQKYALVEPADKSMLADMLYFGKCHQFTKTILPNTPDSLIIGYSQIELDDTEASQEIVWGHFIDQKLLFETSAFTKSKYLDERPHTAEISPDCPGRIGHWLGWKIIKKYVEQKPKESIISLMKNQKAQQIFEESKYKGKEVF
jgi:hypothetical protein